MKNDALTKNVYSWWKTVAPRTGYDTYNGARADLRRCHSISDVMFVPEYHHLLDMSGADRNNTDELASLAVAAWVLSWVKDDVTQDEGSFAAQLAKADPQFKVVRFRRLLETQDFDDLGMQLIRAVRFLGQTADVQSLIDGILFWKRGDSVKRKWAVDYYRFAKDE